MLSPMWLCQSQVTSFTFDLTYFMIPHGCGSWTRTMSPGLRHGSKDSAASLETCSKIYLCYSVIALVPCPCSALCNYLVRSKNNLCEVCNTPQQQWYPCFLFSLMRSGSISATPPPFLVELIIKMVLSPFGTSSRSLNSIILPPFSIILVWNSLFNKV